jgi:hypothetical protein
MGVPAEIRTVNLPNLSEELPLESTYCVLIYIMATVVYGT